MWPCVGGLGVIFITVAVRGGVCSLQYPAVKNHVRKSRRCHTNTFGRPRTHSEVVGTKLDDAEPGTAGLGPCDTR